MLYKGICIYSLIFNKNSIFSNMRVFKKLKVKQMGVKKDDL